MISACNCLEDFHRIYLYRTLGAHLVSPENHDKLMAIVSDSTQSWEQRAWTIAALNQDIPPAKLGQWLLDKNRDYQQTVGIVQRYYGKTGPVSVVIKPK